jgi:hypothetical protein
MLNPDLFSSRLPLKISDTILENALKMKKLGRNRITAVFFSDIQTYSGCGNRSFPDSEFKILFKYAEYELRERYIFTFDAKL